MNPEPPEIITNSSVELAVGTISDYPTTRSGLNLVLLFPGIMNYDVWTSLLKLELSKIDNVRAEIVGISEISLGQFLCDVIFDSHDKYLHLINERIAYLVSEVDPSTIMLIGHSYGAFIITRFLEMYRNYEISGIIVAGSILPADYMWRRTDTKTKLVVNECGQGDYVPVLAGMLSKRFGASGRIGFSDHNAINRWHPNKTHGRFLYFSRVASIRHAEVRECIEKYIKPILSDGLVLDHEGALCPLTKWEKLIRIIMWPASFLPRVMSRLVRAIILVCSGRYFRAANFS